MPLMFKWICEDMVYSTVDGGLARCFSCLVLLVAYRVVLPLSGSWVCFELYWFYYSLHAQAIILLTTESQSMLSGQIR